MEKIDTPPVKPELTYDAEQLQSIAEVYGLPELRFVEAPEFGMITNNAVLKDADGTRYFAKAYRVETSELLAGLYRVAELVATNPNIPVTLPLVPKDNSYTANIADCQLALFPFEDGTSEHPEAPEEFVKLTENMMTLQGQMHTTSLPESDDALRTIPRWQYESIENRHQALERVIEWAESVPEPTDFDRLAARSAREKLALIATLPTPDPDLLVEGLCHADYHMGNVMHNEDLEVTAILDWDNAGVADTNIDFLNVILSNLKSEADLSNILETDILEKMVSAYQTGRGEDFELTRLQNAYLVLLHDRIGTPWPLFQHYRDGHTKNDDRAEILLNRAHFLATHHAQIWNRIEAAVLAINEQG